MKTFVQTPRNMYMQFMHIGLTFLMFCLACIMLRSVVKKLCGKTVEIFLESGQCFSIVYMNSVAFGSEFHRVKRKKGTAKGTHWERFSCFYCCGENSRIEFEENDLLVFSEILKFKIAKYSNIKILQFLVYCKAILLGTIQKEIFTKKVQTLQSMQ